MSIEKQLWEGNDFLSASKSNLVTLTEDLNIAPTDPKINLGLPALSLSLPEAIGFIQRLNAPQGYTFGLTSRDRTSVDSGTYPATPDQSSNPTTPDDLIIARKFVKTESREVIISNTNEVEDDINALFGDSFGGDSAFARDNDESLNVSNYFLRYGGWKVTSKTDSDFVGWLEGESTYKGAITIADYTEYSKILAGVAELKETLFKTSGKSSRTFCIVTPRIASIISSSIDSTVHNNANYFRDGRQNPSPVNNSYVCTIGDTDFYQFNSSNAFGGEGPSAETAGKIYMGLLGGPGSASVYYNPYKKYIIKTGSDFYTGQSAVIFRIRDAWSTNPQDQYDGSSVDVSSGNATLEGTNKSSFLVKADVNFTSSVLQ